MVSALSGRIMSSQRLARASRSRFFIGLGVLIMTVGFVALFHSSQQELDQLRLHEAQCAERQQQLNERNGDLESSLKSERAEHKRTRAELLHSNGEAKEFRDKTMMDANMKFGALQQNYKLLKIQNDDLIDECGKLRATHLEQLSALETKLKNIDAQHEQILRQKQKEAGDLQMRIAELENRSNELQQKLNTANGGSAQSGEQLVALQQQLNAYQAHCSWRPPVDHAAQSAPATAPKSSPAVVGNVGAAPPHNFNAQHLIVPGQAAPQPVAANGPQQQQAPPPAAGGQSSTTASAPNPKPAAAASTATKAKRVRQIPAGVVPIPDSEALIDRPPGDVMQQMIASPAPPTKTVPQENARYANAMGDDAPAAAEPLVGAVDADNGAHEVLDGQDIAHDDHMMPDAGDLLSIGGLKSAMGGNNAAEEDANGTMDETPLLGGAGLLIESQKDQDETDKQILGGARVAGDGKAAAKRGGAPNEQKMEADADHGKEVYPDDAHVEDAMEDDGDDDEYDNIAARKMDPAVRN